MKTKIPSIIFFIIFVTLFQINSTYAFGENKDSRITFLRNEGQWDDKILYCGQSTATRVAFLYDGLSFSQPGEEVELPDGTEDHPFIVWNMKFVNPESSMEIIGSEGKKSVYSYLFGNDPGKWVVHPEEFTHLKYQSVFKNIDLHFYGYGSELKV